MVRQDGNRERNRIKHMIFSSRALSAAAVVAAAPPPPGLTTL
jgi:hypothetical protein